MLDLDPGAAHPVRAVHRDPGLALRPQVQVVLVEPAEQLPGIGLQPLFQVGAGGRRGLRSVEERERRRLARSD